MKSKLFDLASYGPPPAPETPRMARRRRVASALCLASVLAVVGMGPFVRALPQVAILVAVLLITTVGINLLYWVDKNRRDEAFAAGELVEAKVLDPSHELADVAAPVVLEASIVR
jgi:hypothetical protein